MRVFLAAALVLCALACQRETSDVSRNDPSKSSTAAGSPQEAPPQSTAGATPTEKDEPASSPTPASPTQEVHLIEYMVHMPATLTAGRTGFNVENGGKEDHAFVIEGNGIHEETEVLKRGGTSSLTVELKPGTYTVYCPVKDHAQKGMKTTVTVR